MWSTQLDFETVSIILMSACAYDVLGIQHTGNSTSLELQRLLLGVFQLRDAFHSTSKWTFMFFFGLWRVKNIAITWSGISLCHILTIKILKLDQYWLSIKLGHTEHALFKIINFRRQFNLTLFLGHPCHWIWIPLSLSGMTLVEKSTTGFKLVRINRNYEQPWLKNCKEFLLEHYDA